MLYREVLMGIRTWGLALLGVLIIGEQSLGGTSKLQENDKMSIAAARCAPSIDAERTLYRNDVKAGGLQSFSEMRSIYNEVYKSDRRLPSRVYLDPVSSNFISTNGRDSVAFSEEMIKTITLHIETALKLKYADFIFFPDMGHSHLLIPQDYYDNELSLTIGVKNKLSYIMEGSTENIKTLYHTAELLKTHEDRVREVPINDRNLQWRFYTRNPVIDAKGNVEIITNLEQSGNTARAYEGYQYMPGFNISANENGCFPFEDQNGKLQYFDISAWDLTSDCSRVDCNSDQ